MKLPASLFVILCLSLTALPGSPGQSAFSPGTAWLDTNGAPINAHGGGVIFVDGRYYWHGEHKLPNRSEAQKADGGVHCYSSTDLYNWRDEGLVLSVDYQNPKSEIAAGCILERPKVVYNPRTKKYVMYFKLYPPGSGYDTGYVGVAVADKPAGPFTYSHRFVGGGSPKGTGDFCMFRDAAGDVWHYTVRKPDKAFVAGRLTDDYLHPRGDYRVLTEIPALTEAPAMIRLGDGTHYMLGSGSSGWKPNAARSFRAPAAAGPFTDLGNPCAGTNPHNNLGPEKTFGGQISCIIPVEGRPGAYIAMFDLWRPDHAEKGLYAWLPLFIKNGKPVVEWHTKWDLGIFNRSD
ncbi:family 43 glycosylhydrolase [Ereboglobus luteus]|uniref:Beta-glucanase n=1 Tax=Ereboglobus luteus TaxID=1796921 RepID=A0A2U8E3L4_9BACT|nr:family 43 glycosylhydrolase [Ereboglobus luteus]AWI09473.1 hypothetical protein CKA38_09630 [Ereboglobus luteus]